MLRDKMIKVVNSSLPKGSDGKKIIITEEEALKRYFDSLQGSIAKNYRATHVAKYTETNSPGNVGAYDDSPADYECNYLCTANSGWKEPDMLTNDAKNKRIQGFIAFLMDDGRTVMEHLVEDSNELRAEMTALIQDYDELRDKILSMQTVDCLETNQFIKQVYYPVNDNYHLLSVLPSTVLSFETSGRLYKNNSIDSIKVGILTGSAASTTGSRLVSKDKHPNLLLALPPQELKKSLKKSLNREYLLPDFIIDDFSGIEKGCLVDSELLPMIIEEGKRKGAGNYRKLSQRDERKAETMKAFLDKYGYEFLPAGFELHHIVPISQDGADSIKNLIMLSLEDHQVVTAAHKEYFKWRDV